MRRRALAALAVAAGIAVAGCGGGDEEQAGSSAATTASTPAEAEGNTFEASDVGFTFSYPDGFEQLDEPNDGKVIAAVTPTPTNPQNGIKVRVTSEQELAFASYSAEIRGQFEDQLGTDVAMRTEDQGGRELGILSWTKPFTFTDLGEEKTTQLKSTSYFFAEGGKTWQLECLSTAEERKTIDAACQQALESIEPA